jgi:methylamine utilization protein MauE
MPALDPAATWLAALAIAGVLGASALRKLGAFAEFRDAVAGYEIGPRALVTAEAAALVGCEAAAAFALGLHRPLGAALAAGLFALYGAAIGVNLARGRRALDCGCAGPAARQPIRPSLLARNGALIALAVLAAAPATDRALSWIDSLTIVAGAAALWLAYGTLDQLLANQVRSAALREPA